MFERRTPVPEALQRQSVQLATFPLIQIATRQTVQMRPPERFQFRALPGRHSWHDHPSQITKFAVERTSHPEGREQACHRWTLTLFRYPVPGRKFPVLLFKEFWEKPENSAA